MTRSREPAPIVAEAVHGLKGAGVPVGWARRLAVAAQVLSRVLGPLPVTVAATVVAALVAPTARPWATLALVVGLFGGAAVLVVAVLRWRGGPGAVTRRRAVPVVLVAELAALAAGVAAGVPQEVVRGFVAYFVVGAVALAGARANISAHTLLAGALVGLLLGWLPVVGLVGLVALAALAAARVVLGQHTWPQAVLGALVGAGVGLLAATLGA